MAESTLSVFAVSYESVLISIHAPQWGATLAGTSLPVGGRFRSTHPSGVRPSCDNGSMNLIEMCPNGREARNMRRAIAVGRLCHQPYERLGHVTTELVPVESVTMHLTARELMFEND